MMTYVIRLTPDRSASVPLATLSTPRVESVTAGSGSWVDAGVVAPDERRDQVGDPVEQLEPADDLRRLVGAAAPADDGAPLDPPGDLAAGEQQFHHPRVDHGVAVAWLGRAHPEGLVEPVVLELQVVAVERALVRHLQERQLAGQLDRDDGVPEGLLRAAEPLVVQVVESDDLPIAVHPAEHVLRAPVVAGAERFAGPVLGQRGTGRSVAPATGRGELPQRLVTLVHQVGDGVPELPGQHHRDQRAEPHVLHQAGRTSMPA